MIKSLFKSIRKILFLIILVGSLLCAYFISEGYMMYSKAISGMPLDIKIESIKEDEDYVEIKDISIYFKEAVISIEDKRFYEHFGVDLYSIARALVHNFKEKEITGGGSTITQQLAKNMYFTLEQKLSRKVAEVFVALDLEREYSKDEILELYINVIYYGDGYHGIKNATYGYFNKSPKDIDLNESTLLAAIPNAPSIYQLSNNNSYTYTRQKFILNAMYENGFISKDEKDEVINEIENSEN